MNNLTAARLYMLFALVLLMIGWKICQNASEEIQNAQASREADLERTLSSIE